MARCAPSKHTCLGFLRARGCSYTASLQSARGLLTFTARDCLLWEHVCPGWANW